MQVLHHCGNVGSGEVEHLCGGLRAHRQVVVVRRGYFSPFHHDRGTRQCQANYYLRCVGDWEERAGEKASFRMLHSCVVFVRNGAFSRVKTQPEWTIIWHSSYYEYFLVQITLLKLLFI